MKKHFRAFTLIELLVVISIISLLASIILASLNTAQNRAVIAAGLQFEDDTYHAAGDQLAADWEFDNCSGGLTAPDNSGNGNTGTFNTAPPYSNATPSGKGCAVLLNGSQYMTAPNLAFVSPGITYSAWVYPNTTGSGGFSIFHDHNGIGGNGILVHMTGSPNIEFQISTSGSSQADYFNTNTYSVPLKTWTQIVCTYDGANAYIYVNGKLIESGPPSPNVGTVNVVAPMYVGGNGPSADVNGLIDNARIYEKALTALGVQQLYAEEKEELLAMDK